MSISYSAALKQLSGGGLCDNELDPQLVARAVEGVEKGQYTLKALYRALFSGCTWNVERGVVRIMDSDEYRQYTAEINRFVRQLNSGRGATYRGIKVPPLRISDILSERSSP